MNVEQIQIDTFKFAKLKKIVFDTKNTKDGPIFP